MATTGNRRVQYLIAFSVAIVAMGMGTFTAWPAPVMPKFKGNQTAIPVSESEMAWIVATSSPGYMAGSLFCGFIADRVGRRATILYSALPTMFGTIIAASTTVAWLLYITRFSWGFGYGMYNSVVSLYLAEIADKEIRGSTNLVTRFMFNFGNLLMMCIGPFVSFTTINYMLLILPPLYVIVCWWIPETPYYLLKEQRVDAARNVLSRVRVYDSDKALESDLMQMKIDVKNEMRSSSSFSELVTGRKYRKAISVATGLKGAQLFTGVMVLTQYLGIILTDSHLNMENTTAFIIYGAATFVTGTMCSVIADRVGRRPLLIFSFLGSGSCLTVVGVYFYLLEVAKVDRELINPYSFVPFVGIILCNVMATLGFYSLAFVIPAEIFPLNVKAIALTSLSIYSGLLNFVVARGFQYLKDIASYCGVFWVLGASAIFGSIFSYYGIPETRGKSLRQIQEELQGPFYVADEVCEKLNGAVDADKNAEECRELLELKKKVEV